MPKFATVEFRPFDYDGFKHSLFQLAVNTFTNWTDTLESNQGVMFVEWLAYIAANTAYTQNFHARQCFVPTVTEDKNVTKLAKSFAYKIPSNVSAGTDVTISEANGNNFAADVIIPPGTQLLTSGTDKLIFETTASLTIPGGVSEGTVAAKHQETKTEVDTSDGSPDFRSRMTYGPYIEGSMTVAVDNVPWVQVDNFLDSGANDEHFRLEVGSDQIVTVIFGDGVSGKIPLLDAELDYTYKVGGGTKGNVPPGTITQIVGTFYDINNDPVDLVVTNASAAEGGEDREAISVTRLRLPASLSAKEITINYPDFVTNVGSVAGVARVSIQTVNDDPNVPENTVICIVLPTSSDTISQNLEALIAVALTQNPVPLTQNLILANPAFKTIDIDIRDLVVEAAFADNSGTYAAATITISNNTFNVGDKVTVNGVDFTQGVHWTPGVNANASAAALAAAIEASVDPLLQDITASSTNAVVHLRARTKGVHGNLYTLTETDNATDNFTLSGGTFSSGTDTTVQTAIRTAINAFFGRTNTDENDEYTVGFGLPVFRNRLIWLIQDVAIGGAPAVESFTLETPIDDTTLQVNEFPKYTLKFTTT